MKRLVSIILGALILLGAIRSYRLYQDSSATPLEAVKNYITRVAIASQSPQKIESLNVVSSTPSNRDANEQLLLFQAYDRGLQTHIVGYATVKKSLLGWYVDNFQTTGMSPLPSDAMVGLDRSDRGPIVYGQIFLDDAIRVDAVFGDPNQGDVTISADLHQGSFAIFGTPYSELSELKILDGNGNVLKQLRTDELPNG